MCKCEPTKKNAATCDICGSIGSGKKCSNLDLKVLTLARFLPFSLYAARFFSCRDHNNQFSSCCSYLHNTVDKYEIYNSLEQIQNLFNFLKNLRTYFWHLVFSIFNSLIQFFLLLENAENFFFASCSFNFIFKCLRTISCLSKSKSRTL